ncbi:hypothetical protein Tco_1414975, partial [Tanacetum coccineum]
MQQSPPNDNYNPQPPFNQNYMQQPMINPEDIFDPTTAMNMTLVLIAKAFKLNYLKPTNNNQRISSNPHNRQIAQPGINMGQDKRMYMVGGNGRNQFRQYVGQNIVRNQNGLIVVLGIANPNANQNGKGNVVAAQAEGDLDKIEEVNANCILMANLQQASTSGTQTDKAPVYDSDGSAEQCLTKKINALHLSSAKMITTLNEEIENLNNQLSKEKSTVSFLNEEKKKLKSDFKIRKEELLDKQIQLENKINELDNILALEFKIECLLRAVVSQDIMPIVQNPTVVEISDLQTELERMKE